MDYVHRCVMCDWQRPAETPAVTSPRCGNCGCALESVRASEIGSVEWLGEGIAVPEGVRRAFVRAAAIAGTAVLMLAAVRTGYTEGGIAMAVTAFGVAGLFVVMAMAAEHA